MAGGLGKKSRAVFHAAALDVLRPVVQSPDTGEGNGGSAHRAWLERDIEIATRQTLVIQRFAALPDDQNLRMGGGIVAFPGAVSGLGQNHAVLHQNGTDGHFAAFCRCLCLGQGKVHGSHRISFLVHAALMVQNLLASCRHSW
eukprot:gene8653-10651_t